MIARADSKLECLPRELRRGADHIALPAAEYGGEIAVTARGDGEAAQMGERPLDIDNARQFICTHTHGYARAAHHPCRV